jgi:ribosomal protein L11 methyltransferase
MAFGTGLHPTTRLCLELLEEYLPKYQKYQNTAEANLKRPKVLDLGTGSGVLAIAAQKLGAESVYALDTDPVAVKVSRENFERNGLLTQIQAEVGSIAVVPGSTDGFYAFADEVQRTPAVITQAMPFDIVVANIIARIITALAPALAAALCPSGLLIVSGIINNHADETQAALEIAGFQILQRLEEDDWVAMVGCLTAPLDTQGQTA